LVWVRGSWLPSFVERVLPRIRGHFVLVTGDTPSSLPSSAPTAAAALLESPYMLHWYTQNYDGTAGPSRVSPIPVGIDLHTRSVRPAWGQAIGHGRRWRSAMSSWCRPRRSIRCSRRCGRFRLPAGATSPPII
jgi:hypothetical protein